jgi:sugar lactone lactonase YvrE
VGTGAQGARNGVDAQFNLPRGVFLGQEGELYVLDTSNNLVRSVDANGETSTVAGRVMPLDGRGFPSGFYRDGGIARALFNRPADGLVDGEGRMVVLDSSNHVLRIVVGESVYSLAGGNGPGHADGHATAAKFYDPRAIAAGSDGSFYIADTQNHVIRRLEPGGTVATVAGVPGTAGYADGQEQQALFNAPMGIAVSPQGDIYVADTGNHLVRVVSGGKVSTIGGMLVFPSAAERETADESFWDNVPVGGFADGSESQFNMPMGLALWGDVLVVADAANHRVRGITPEGVAFSFAGDGTPGHEDGAGSSAVFHMPTGVVVNGNSIVVADSGNSLVRVVQLSSSTTE